MRKIGINLKELIFGKKEKIVEEKEKPFNVIIKIVTRKEVSVKATDEVIARLKAIDYAKECMAFSPMIDDITVEDCQEIQGFKNG